MQRAALKSEASEGTERKADEFWRRPCVRFPHDDGTMVLDGALTNAEVGRYVLAWMTGKNHLHDVALSFCEARNERRSSVMPRCKYLPRNWSSAHSIALSNSAQSTGFSMKAVASVWQDSEIAAVTGILRSGTTSTFSLLVSCAPSVQESSRNRCPKAVHCRLLAAGCEHLSNNERVTRRERGSHSPQLHTVQAKRVHHHRQRRKGHRGTREHR